MSVTKMLLMGDVDVNETDPEGNTALHWCISSSSSTQEPRCLFKEILLH
jgi:ankyrin repeat protein